VVEIIAPMSNLPNLPTKHKKREANMGVEFRHKFKSIKHMFTNAIFELKQTEENRFYLRHLKPKQRTSNKGLIRLSVATEGSGDYEYHTTTPLFIVIKFKRNMYVIPVENIDFSKVSLTEEDCLSIAKCKI
jgi:hypothetical protein